MGWSQVPDRSAASLRPSPVPPWLLGALPVVLQIRDYEVAGGWMQWFLRWTLPLLAVALAVVVVSRAARAWSLIVGIAAVALCWLILPEGGAELGAVLVAGTLLWSLGLGVIVIAGDRLRHGRALWPALAIVVVGDVLLVLGPNLRLPAAVLGVAWVVAGSCVLWPASALAMVAAAETALAPLEPVANGVAHLIERPARAVGTVVRVVALVPAAVVMNVMWLLHRIVGHDPLSAPSGPGTRWVRRQGEDPHPQRYYSSTRVDDRRRIAERVSGTAVVVVLVALLAGATLLVAGNGGQASVMQPHLEATEAPEAAADPQCDPSDDPVLSAQEDYEVMACERSRAFSSGEFRAPSGYTMSDFEGEAINVVDGVRRTWRPPPCDCRRLRVWWFGGSAAWGEGQSDLSTLPSMVARAAWDEGVVLDIVNRAMPTWTFGQETHLFADRLTEETPPDLAVFYTGGNDLVFQGLRLLDGRPEDDSDIVLNERALSDLYSLGVPVRPEQIHWSPTPDTFENTLTPEVARTLAAPAMSRLSRNFELVRMLGVASATPVKVFLQPLLAGSGPGAAPPSVMADDLVDSFTALVEEARTQIPDGIEDMTSVYVGVDEPVFFDLFHTGERGAEIMAAEMLDRLRPQLDDLLAAEH